MQSGKQINNPQDGKMLIDQYWITISDYYYPIEFCENPCNKRAASFIWKYLDARSKETVYNFRFSNGKALYSKSAHTVSAFLLGMYLSELVDKQVVQLMKNNTTEIIQKFDYPWFLCCLFHDAFSKYEKEHKKGAEPSFELMKKRLKIIHDIYTKEEDILPNWDWPITYKQETVKEYYNQRFENGLKDEGIGIVDHGILSGYYFFDRLVRNYLRNKKLNGNKDHFDTHNNGFTLIWDKDQIWVFGLAADAIIAHNIWHVNKYSNIPQLCPGGDHERKLSIKETPLAYFLSLIDTIEPVKYFSNKYSITKILSNISIELKDKKEIVIKQQGKVFDFETWYYKKDMDKLESWLEGTKAELSPDKRRITITLPEQLSTID